MKHQQHRHAPSAEPLEHRHALARRDRERDGLRVAVEEIDVARSAGQRTGRVDAIADILHAGWRVARDDAPLHLVVEAKRRNALILAVEDAGLAVGCCRRKTTKPAPECIPFFADHLRDRRTVAQLDAAAKLGVRECVDL